MLFRLLVRWAVPFCAILLGAYLFPGWFAVQDLSAAAVFALVLSILNALVRPVVEFLAVPITCLTLGLFHLVINAVFFGIAAWLVSGVAVEGFVAAVAGALLVSALGLMMSMLLD
jgi:putative membrane protein